MSDLERLAADLGRALDSEPLPDIRLSDDPSESAAQISGLVGHLAGAPAALVSVLDRDLAGEGAGRSAAEFLDALERAELRVEWLGISDAHGSVGRRCGLTAAVAGTRPGEVGEILSGGPLGLRFDREAGGGDIAERKADVCIATYEFVGPTRTGGIGTAYTSLAEALADAGHRVTVLFSGSIDPGGRPLEHWIAHYREQGIDLHGLPSELPAGSASGSRHVNRSFQVYRWLREAERRRPFDVIHLPEVLGHGFYAVRAKRMGLAFARTTIALGTHSSTSWVLEQNGTLLQARDDFIDDFIERETIAGADVVISPSAYMLDWMRSEGWQLPRRHFVQQYVRSAAVESLAREHVEVDAGSLHAPRTTTTEVVFFGRLEPRKGIRVFCDALDRLAAEDSARALAITFLGKESSVDGIPAARYIAERSRKWPWQPKVITDLDQPSAVAYLRRPGPRLTVIPSLADNSPNTVYEALALRIPLIASRVGGTAELIDPRDLARATFDPGDPDDVRKRAEGATRLAERIASAVSSERFEPPRPAVLADACRGAHLDWHAALAATPAALTSAGADRDMPRVSVCIIGGDRALIARTRASINRAGEVLESATHAAAAPAGDLALFVSAGVELAPGGVERVAAVSRHRPGAVIASAISGSAGDDPVRLPIGGPPLAGLFRRCFGDSLFAVDRATLERLGGFDAAVEPDIQAHVWLCRAALSETPIEVTAEALGFASEGALPEPEVAIPGRRNEALLSVYREAPGPALRQLPLLAQQIWANEGAWERAYLALYRERFGRLTGPVRYIVHKLRRLEALWARLRGH